LGNFIFDQDFSVETRHGQILKVILQDKTIESVDLIDVYDSLNFQVSLSKD